MQILGPEVEGICVCVSLTKIWGRVPSFPPVDFYDILAAVQGELVGL